MYLQLVPMVLKVVPMVLKLVPMVFKKVPMVFRKIFVVPMVLGSYGFSNLNDTLHVGRLAKVVYTHSNFDSPKR